MPRSRLRDAFVPALLALVLASAGAAEPVRPLADLPALAEMPDRWTQVMDLFDVPGMSVAVVQGDRVYAQGFGIRDPQSGAAVTPETLFYIASITKTFTATTLCALADAKRLSLDDPVQKYLPRFQLADAQLAAKITIRDLLCHRYGLDSAPIVLLDAFTGEITEDRYYHWLAEAEAKGATQYSNLHFTILGRVIEASTGKSWRDELAEHILKPAGMPRTTGYASKMYGDANAAVPMERVDGAWRAVAQRKTDRTMHAAGGLGTTALEGARWLRLHLADGTMDGKRILAPETARAMRATESKLAEPEGTIRIMEGYGFAWNVGSFSGRRLCQHAGGYAGASAYMAMLPDDGVGFIVLVNAGGAARGLMDIVAIDILERMTETKAAWDVYERRTAQAREMKQKMAAAPVTAASEEPVPMALAHPSTAYAGSFSNPWWGTLEVQPNGDRLVCRLGEMPLDIRPLDGGSDHFLIEELLDEKTSGKFLGASDGTIEAIELLHPKFGVVTFQR